MSSIPSKPTISVVIPSTARQSLDRAVSSAVNQVGVDIDVVVIVNGTESLPRIGLPGVRVVDARHLAGQGLARQLGVDNSLSEYVALLDDDDYWAPAKCINQLEDVLALRGNLDGAWVAATGLTIHRQAGQVELRPRSNDRPQIISAPAEYLFRRSKLERLDHFIQASSLLFPRSLADQVPFSRLPEVHTDWGWVLTACRSQSADLILASGHATHYDLTFPGVSRTNRTFKSIEWAQQFVGTESKRIIGDFVFTVTAPIAALHGDLSGFVRALHYGVTRGRPGLPATILGIRTGLRAVGRALKRRWER